LTSRGRLSTKGEGELSGGRPPVKLHYMDTVKEMKALEITKNTITLEKSETG